MYKRGLILLSIIVLMLTPVFAVEKPTLIINSKEWKDVYAGMIYGRITPANPQFLTSQPHSTVILAGIDKDQEIIVFSSKDRPWVFSYDSLILSEGYNLIEEREFTSLSLELARELENISKFIIIDDSYGYNAIAVAPYALLTNSYVLFADNTNIAEIEDLFEQNEPEEIIIYGHVDREVIESLQAFNPEIINKDGDRYENNVEIVKKFIAIKEVGQAILTNGEFIEESIMSPEYPVIFIGNNNVPDAIKEFVTSSQINAGVLIGNNLVGTATIIRRELGISVFVKFARSARTPDGPIAQVEDLDYFFVPRIILDLNFSAVRYNRLTNQLEITYRNNADVATYFKGSYTVIEGAEEQTFGDLESIFIGPNSFKTLVYNIDQLTTDTAEFNYFTIFGESKNSLEFTLIGAANISTIDIKDDTKIQYNNVYYDKRKERFVAEIENIGEKGVYVDSEIIDVYIINERLTLASDETIFIKPGRTKKAYIDADLSDDDIAGNPTVRIRSYYGERENALIKVLEGEFEMVVRDATFVTYLPTMIIIIILILLLLRITKKKCENCGHKNHKKRKKCKKCGVDLK